MSVVAFICAQRAEHGVPYAVACRALSRSQAWFYKWRQRGISTREQRRRRLDAAVAQTFHWRGGRDGSPRITVRLRRAGWRISKNTVAASMRRQTLVQEEEPLQLGPRRLLGERPVRLGLLIAQKFHRHEPDRSHPRSRPGGISPNPSGEVDHCASRHDRSHR
jgi:hypothetical protein